jgi:hypothetical protein
MRRDRDEQVTANLITDQPRVYKEVRQGERSLIYGARDVFEKKGKGKIYFSEHKTESFYIHRNAVLLVTVREYRIYR